MSNRSVCIYGPWASALFEGRVDGGAGLQMALLARAFAARGIPTTVVDPHGTRAHLVDKNLTVIPVPRWNGGIRGLRMLTHRMPSLIETLRSTKAMIYYARGFSAFQLLPLYVARRTGAKFILASSHDSELAGFRERYRTFYRRNMSPWGWLSTVLPDEIGCRIVQNGADYLLVQHSDQEVLSRRMRRKPSIILKNIVGEDVFGVPESTERRNFVIVGWITARKGLRSLIPVIRDLPHLVFEFVGDARGTEGQMVKQDLLQYPNVVIHGVLDRRGTLLRIAGARALINTSAMEGFPNTFLEAWALGTPVVSLNVDPEGVINRLKFGCACGGNTEMLKEILVSGLFSADRTHMREYVLRYHSASNAMEIFESIFRHIEAGVQ